MRLFSSKKRSVHEGPYPMELLKRGPMPDLKSIPKMEAISFRRPEQPNSIVNAMCEYQAMLDAIRDGFINRAKAEIPNDKIKRSNHFKAFGYFSDAAVVGICKLSSNNILDIPIHNPDITPLAEALRTRQTKTLASGIDLIMADLKESMEAPPTTIKGHTHAIVFLYENPRQIKKSEAGVEWLENALSHRACLRANETSAVIANYIRLLGFDAKSHSGAASDVDLNQLAVSSGLVWVNGNHLVAPYIGTNFGLSVVTCKIDLEVDRPLAPVEAQSWFKTKGPRWWLGINSEKNVLNKDPYSKRNFVDGAHTFERLKRVDKPTTYIDEASVARVPKRTDMFARAQFGDMGKTIQKGATGGHYVRKSAPSSAQRRALGAFVLLQDGEPKASSIQLKNEKKNSDNIKAASYFLGVDAVGISRCPEWAWYSHDATGAPIDPPHSNAISMIIDQGYETMEGASGDDWISVAQSMRAYLRFSLLGGVIAQQIRNLGYKAKAHSVMDGDVLQPPLLLLSGLGEVSRIGEVILNPYLGPRLKSGVVTTDMPLSYDKPIDFGLQNFCENCNKCARECPSGAITAGPKLMFNGYEIWKSDSQKCASYRITTEGGAMCGRCMKTCPWNLEGLFAEAPFRWAASNIPKLAKPLAKLDDLVGNGDLNDVKKWWWDIELSEDGAYRSSTKPLNRRGLQRDLDLRYKDQTLAVYPANLAPHPYPYPYNMDREAGIEAYQAMITAEEYKIKLERGETNQIHKYQIPNDAPVIQVVVSKVEKMTDLITKYEFCHPDGLKLPKWSSGAHIDIVVVPEFLRQYSMSGDPDDRSKYQIGVLLENNGRGGSKTLQRIFSHGRRVFISKPINHFELDETANKTYLLGGGIGITPMIAFAHRLHKIKKDFIMHYSASSESDAGYLNDLKSAPWFDKVCMHFSDQGNRADFNKIVPNYSENDHAYICGSERYMDAVVNTLERKKFPDENRHLEYFSVPEEPDYVNSNFRLKLNQSGTEYIVPKDKTAADVLNENGFQINVKCSDGLCGVCKCGLISGEVEHRDFVLSKKQRQNEIILCKSRALKEGGLIEIEESSLK